MDTFIKHTLHFLIPATLGTSLAFSDHPTISLEDGSAGPITTVSAVTAPQGTFGFSQQSQIISNDEISDSDLRHHSSDGKNIHSTESLISLGAQIIYALNDDFTIGLSLPYIKRNNIREAGHHGHDEEHEDEHEPEEHEEEAESGTVERLGDSNGLGDMTLYGKFRFFHDEANDRHAALIAGIKTPTGRTNVRSNEGERFEAEHQPGSGSWDPMLGLAYTQRIGRWSLDANALYTLATDGSQDTNLGDILNYNLALSYRMIGGQCRHGSDACQCATSAEPHHHGATWDLILEANGDWRDKVDIDGSDDQNTGGNLVYLSAGSRITFGKNWAATASVGIPAIEDLNGIQSEPESRILIGISKAF